MDNFERTLPPAMRNMNQDNLIGTFNLVTGHTYNVRDVYQPLVKKRLREPTFHNTGICLSDNVNPYAAFKPHRWLSAPDFHRSGMYLWDPGGGAGHEFIYLRPNNSSGYHLGDFAAYNHNALRPGIPFESVPIIFNSPGERDGNIWLRFPEWDVTDFATITHIRLRTYTGASYGTLNATEILEIMNVWLEFQTTAINYKLDVSGTSNIDYKIVIDLGKVDGSFIKLAEFPQYINIGEETKGPLEIEKTALYNPGPQVYVFSLDLNYATEITNTTVNTGNRTVGFSINVFYQSQTESYQVGGTCAVNLLDKGGNPNNPDDLTFLTNIMFDATPTPHEYSISIPSEWGTIDEDILLFLTNFSITS